MNTYIAEQKCWVVSFNGDDPPIFVELDVGQQIIGGTGFEVFLEKEKAIAKMKLLNPQWTEYSNNTGNFLDLYNTVPTVHLEPVQDTYIENDVTMKLI